MPQFAHVPLILGPDKKRLSKRHGATSVMEYARQGYLPEAMVNFLALLGWSPGSGDQEVFTRERAGRRRSISDGISGGNAVFNPEKLDWFNQQHIVRLRARRARAARASRRSRRPGCGATSMLGDGTRGSSRCCELLKPRAKRLDEFVELGRFFFVDEIEYDAAAVAKHLRVDGMRDHLAALDAAFGQLAGLRRAVHRAGAARGRGCDGAPRRHRSSTRCGWR